MKDDLISEMAKDYVRIKPLIHWLEQGKTDCPPHIFKQITVKKYANRFGIKIFIETGTYLGDMILSVKDHFEKIVSIELGDKLYKEAMHKFINYKHISVYHGDSSTVLPEILKKIYEPCLFWLDAHYSEGITVKGKLETPILQELDCILKHKIAGHVILIDDARAFVGKNDYPTLKQLRDFVENRLTNCFFDVTNDIIRIHGIKPEENKSQFNEN
ncbi:MAG: hypothetical protein HQ580_10515 [Planctomycetes bacterium]|nr:hypothetical protein [Planctomycetota bacterium]